MEWERFLDGFGKRLLTALGENPRYLPSDHNPITDALKDDLFVEQYQDLDGFSRVGLSRVATICQMAVFDADGGPEGDGKPKALRRHWYSWYKAHFAQPLARQLGDVKPNAQGIDEMNDTGWAGRLSQTYAAFVDSRDITYRDLWVEDASRMMVDNWQVLFQGCHIILAVEKDSLFADFGAAAKALGAKAVYSGKGKSSKAAIEKLLRESFRWSPDWNPFDSNPLIVLHISDHDFDGEAVIGPTFAQQCRRYTANVYEARVGIKPESVRAAGYDWQDKWYTVKVSNKGYQRWAENKALFLAECENCGHLWAIETADHEQREGCPECGRAHQEINAMVHSPYGFEVEAMRTRDYYGLIVDALLQVLPFDYIVNRLRDECTASARDVADRIADEVLKANDSYQSLLARFEELEEIKSEFESRIREDIGQVGEPHVRDFWHLEDDPEPEDYSQWVTDANDWTGPWRPFSIEVRTAALEKLVREQASARIESLKIEHIW